MRTLHFVAALASAFTLSTAANAVVFTATMAPENENPPAAGSSGTGTATVTLDEVAQTLSVEIVFSGLTGTTTDAHIHCCTTPDMNAGVAIPFSATFPLGVTSGSFSQVYDLTDAGTFTAAFITNNGGSVASAAAALIAGLVAGEAYANLHTSFVGSGEIRGNLAAVPLPAAVWLFAAGAAGLGGMRRLKTRKA